jgi:4a-hydroxytetrahydrobiopterin dehydratase
MPLADENCVNPKTGGPGASAKAISELSRGVSDWEIVDYNGMPHLQRVFAFADFGSAMSFATSVGAEADDQDHHPRITVEWGSALVEWWTHATGGLHRNDFIMAAKSDRLFATHQVRS